MPPKMPSGKFRGSHRTLASRAKEAKSGLAQQQQTQENAIGQHGFQLPGEDIDRDKRMGGYDSGDDTFFGGFGGSENEGLDDEGLDDEDILVAVSIPLERDHFWHLYVIFPCKITYEKSNITTF
jgi:hypothetical protein